MGIVFRQSVKTTIISFTGVLLGAACMLGYTYILSQQEYGFVRDILNRGALLQTVALMGVSGAAATFIMRYPAGRQRMTLFALCLMVPLAMTVLMTIPYYAFRPGIVQLYRQQDRPLVNAYYYLIPVLVLCWSYMTLFETYLAALNKTAVSAFMREIVLRVLNLVFLALLYFRLIPLPVFIISTVLVYILPSVIMLWLSYRTTEAFSLTFDRHSLTRQDYRDFFVFSVYHMLAGVSAIAMQYIDSNMLGILSPKGLSSVSVYTNAAFLVMMTTVPFRAMSAATMPTLNMAYIRNDHARLEDAFNRSAINVLIVSVAMTVLLLCNMHNATAVLPPSYKSITQLVLILMLGRLVELGTGFNTEIIQLSRYYKFNFRILLFLLLTQIAGCYLLIPRFEAAGAAWATTIAFLLFNIGKVLFVRRRLQLWPFSGKTVRVLLAGGLTAAAGYFFPFVGNPYADAVVRSCVVMAVYGGLLLWLKPSQDLQTYLQSVRKNKRLF